MPTNIVLWACSECGFDSYRIMGQENTPGVVNFVCAGCDQEFQTVRIEKLEAPPQERN